MVFPNANKEGYAQRGVAMVQEALSEKTKVFRAGRKSLDEVLEAAEFCANLLEACELVPMYDRSRQNVSLSALYWQGSRLPPAKQTAPD